MALGTPVAGAVAYSAQNGTTVSPAYPASIAATDAVLLFVGQKPSTANGGTVTTPAGWTLRASLTGAGGYGTTLGADTGNTNLRIYSWDNPVAGQTGNLSVTLGTNNVTWAFMVRVPGGGGALSYGSATGQRTTAPTAGTPFSVTLTNGANPTNFQTGDVAVWAMCIPTDVTTPGQFATQDITATGAVFGTPVELNEPDSGTGNDIGGYSAWDNVDSGSSTVAPTVTVTASGTVTNVRGPIVLVRVREANAFTLDAQPGTFTYTGGDTTLSRTVSFNAEAGAFTYTGQDAELTKSAALKELNAEAGAFTYTGQAVELDVGRALSLEAGTFTYTGQAATLSRTRSFNAEAGAFTYTGQAAHLSLARNINAAAGVFTYTGQAAALTKTYSFNAEAGAFTYTGQDAELLYVAARTIDAEAGAFTYTGQAATLTRTASLNAEAGAFTYTGQAASLLVGYSVNAEAGAFAYTGQNAELVYTQAAKEINAAAGSFDILGQDATFLRTRAFNAEAAAFGEANPYVDPGYMNPGYVTGLFATLGYGRAFNAESGIFLLTGQPATFTTGTLYPPESDVRLGVVYGPGGIYVGAYAPVGGKQPLYIFDD